MPDYDRGFKIVAHQSGRELCKLAGLTCESWRPIVDTMQATERLADRAFVARQGRQRFVVYFEAYTRWTDSARWSVLAKSGLLSERERLPTRSVVFMLLPRGYRPQQGEFRLELDSELTQLVRFREVCLWQQVPRPSWELAPGLMALYPLCRHGRRRREALTYPAKAIAQHVSDPPLRADLLATLSIFGKLVYPDLNVIELIGRERMKESKFFEEVMDEGRAEARRSDILHALGIRLDRETAATFRKDLEQIKDLDRLTDLHAVAIKCRRVAEFRRALDSVGSAR
jgi:hypothetical protein